MGNYTSLPKRVTAALFTHTSIFPNVSSAVARPMPVDAPVMTITDSAIFLDTAHLHCDDNTPLATGSGIRYDAFTPALSKKGGFVAAL